MSKEKDDVEMEIDENNDKEAKIDEECVLICSNQDEDNEINQQKSPPSTPSCDKKSNLNLSKTNFNSAEKLDKNLKLQIKLENAKKRQEEKERKEREKKEREEQRIKREEEWRRKREEEERQKQKRQEEREKEKERKAAEFAEKERIRLEQLNARNEEKKKREEERRQKEEEKLKEEEEKRRKEEKVKNQFKSFFIKKESSLTEKHEDHKNYRFLPFQPKENMRVAPICRREDILYMNSEEREQFYLNMYKEIFDRNENETVPNYLNEIRKNPNLIRKKTIRCRRNQIRNDEDSNSCDVKELVVIPTHPKFKVKYLHFDPKVYKRPPYYGTWRKKSKFVKPRRPFGKDEKIFDYEIDSDDEWEDEPEGESIADSEKGDEDEEIIDEDDDDGFFVPHGHLSDDELDEDERTLDPETKKARESARKEAWEAERKKSSKVLVPKCFIINNYWSTENTVNSDSKVLDEIKLFEKLKIVPLVTNFPINIFNETVNQKKTEESTSTKPAKSKNSNLAANEASPSTVKTAKAKSKIQLNPQSPSLNTSTNNSTLTNTSASPATPSIIKFISKMSKKDVICKLEPVNTGNSTSTTTTAPMSPLTSKVTANFATPGTPNSPKMTPTSSTAEKRVCSGNGENAVKRLKLDENQSNEQKVTTTPNSIMNMFKSSGSCKKSLKMSNNMSKSESNEMEVEMSKKTDLSNEDKPKNESNDKENNIKVITID